MKLATTIFLVLTAFGVAFAADLGRGRELYAEGKYDDAITELRQVVQDQPDNADAHRLLGLALIEDGKSSDAAKHLDRAMELASSGETKLALARLAVAQKNYSRAEELLTDASGDELEYVRGLVHLNRNRFKDSAEDLEAYLEKNPQHAYAHYYAGMAYNGAKRPDRMLSHFETFVKLKPDAPEARKVRSVLKTVR